MNLNAGKPYWAIPYLYIWGIQWMASSLLYYWWMLDPAGTIRAVLPWVALALSAAVAFARRRNKPQGAPAGGSAPTWRNVAIAGLCAAVVLALFLAVLLYAGVNASPLLYAELFRAFALAAFYAYTGWRFGRELVFLGIWLIALLVVVAGWYAGYAPIVLGVSEGASLIACAFILQLWRKTAGTLSLTAGSPGAGRN
ncbi:hypothetical protein ACFFNY_31100 [Paenibacillus hodogayensis]|uniref:Uncharacterized protein n=1 Tax=Paenibacillus hodogayensis TaxID=279208 RepID=A0ABV5W657_9BACL